MGKKKPVARDEEGGVVGNKAKKKGPVIDDDEYSIGTELSEDQEKKDEQNDDEIVISFTGKKKSKKGAKAALGNGETNGKTELPDEVEQENKVDVEEEDDVPAIVFSGKKKPKSKKSNNNKSLSSFGAILMEEENDEAESEQPPPADASKGAGEQEETDAKKLQQQKKKKKKSGKFAIEDDDDSQFAVSSLAAAGLADEDGFDEPEPELEFEQPPKKDVDSKAYKQGNEDLPDVSKKQKKKKKGGRTAQEEDDLDKILAELGEGPAAKKSDIPPMVEENKVPSEAIGSVDLTAEPNAAGGDAEPEGVESAAAKKKKKKKEKEKEKKAATAAAAVDEKSVTEMKEEKTVVETKGKVLDKKVPKKVREMQEALARVKEAEERKKREEEERLRKEEEERLRLEEIERQKEEAKRRKKEREKEKLLKKKQEGKLLTGKQKEEARRLELMRNQFLAQGGLPVETSGVTKRPKYQTKKKAKPGPAQVNDRDPVETGDAMEDQNEGNRAEVDQSEVEEKVEEESTIGETEDKLEAEQELEEEIEEDEDEWDAKSWDDATLALPVKTKSAFEEDEADLVVKKGTKGVVAPTSIDPVPPKTASMKPSYAKNAVASEVLTHKPPPAAQVVAAGKISHLSGKREVTESKDDESEDEEDTDIKKKTEAAIKREARKAEALSKRSADNLRSPICCILGHVDTGKTKLLDCIRGTNVQEGEAGGITQQIGATYFPAENIRERTKELKADAKLRVPGLLVIDTPGHESFTNLRSRGSGLCDIAILVVDIMHGLEPQTIESINLLKKRKTEFIIALNKVDRLYGWKTFPNAPILKSLKQQSNDVRNEFNMRLNGVNGIIVQLKEQGLNSELYYKNKEMGETISIVPTSAISGEGIPDLLLLLVQWTQRTMEQKLMFVNEVECTVLEVKVIEGLGTTIDVVLVNGVLHEGDQIVVCGVQGPIVTTIRALLTPHPMKELRVKGSYMHHKELKAAQGIKISAQGLEHAIAGTGLYVVGPGDDLDDIKDAAMRDVENVMSKIDRSGEGVCVQASTLGSLEALLEFLKSPAVKIPVSGISIGPVHKKDVMRANVMNERKMKEYAVILAFDVKVMPEARELADEYGVKIFMADIIYHLFDQFKAYIDNLKEEKKKEAAEEAVFPCVLRIVPNCIFNKKDPIVLGVDVLEGIAKIGTPMCIPSRDFIDIGRIASIEINHKQVDVAKKGHNVAIKIVSSNPEEAQKMFGRHFEIEDELVSHISRKSIDVLKTNYREDLSNDEWRLVVKLKNLFKIQ